MADLIRLAIIDDHPATAAGLASLLAGEPDLEVVGVATSLPAAERLLAGAQLDVALIDIVLDGQPAGLELVARHAGRVAAILFSSYDQAGFYARALEDGARGFLPKSARVTDIVTAIHRVAAGDLAFSAAVMAHARMALPSPSERELLVIELVVEGLSNDEIGARLGLTEKSVESHLRRLFARYGLATRTELAFLAVRQGWISLSR
jgi:DNA-binding NarL/FixJ family response regulator